MFERRAGGDVRSLRIYILWEALTERLHAWLVERAINAGKRAEKKVRNLGYMHTGTIID